MNITCKTVALMLKLDFYLNLADFEGTNSIWWLCCSLILFNLNVSIERALNQKAHHKLSDRWMRYGKCHQFYRITFRAICVCVCAVECRAWAWYFKMIVFPLMLPMDAFISTEYFLFDLYFMHLVFQSFVIIWMLIGAYIKGHFELISRNEWHLVCLLQNIFDYYSLVCAFSPQNLILLSPFDRNSFAPFAIPLWLQTVMVGVVWNVHNNEIRRK